MGLSQYYHKFIPDLASITTPLQRALKTSEDFVMSDETVESINRVKQALLCSEALAPFDATLPTR